MSLPSLLLCSADEDIIEMAGEDLSSTDARVSAAELAGESSSSSDGQFEVKPPRSALKSR